MTGDHLPRPTVWTPEVMAAITATLRAGGFLSHACRSAGIAPSTFYRWRDAHRRGEPQPEPMAKFFRDVELAIATAETAALSRVSAGEKDWRAAAWFLERRFPMRWGNRPDAIGDRDAAPPKPLEDMTDDELAEYGRSIGVQWSIDGR